ncbi:MAG: rhomboid family intramembrane serine protease [Oscillospiraceae bacterium]|nr:rhomboid family intramembrane serine protease [Oscillospiraceae bacterium]
MIDRVKRAPVTFIIIGINLIIFILETMAGGSTSTRVAVSFGAQATPLLAAGQYWRLFTAMFLHFGITHLACNMISLYNLGPALERLYGRGRYIAVYLFSGLAGNFCTWFIELLREDYALSAGASGAIFGLFGAYIALALIPAMRERISVRGIVITLVLNLAYGLTYPSVNMVAHLGGLVAGAVLAGIMVLLIMKKSRASV